MLTLSLRDLAVLTGVPLAEVQKNARCGWYGDQQEKRVAITALAATEILADLEDLVQRRLLTQREAAEVAHDVIFNELPEAFYAAVARPEPWPLGYVTKKNRKVVKLPGVVRAAYTFKRLIGGDSSTRTSKSSKTTK